jgi:hypothetical protein
VDRKGFEIAPLTTLLTIHDMAAANNVPADPVVLAPPMLPEAPPSPPPRPAPKTGVNRIAEMHAMRYEPNEVTVNEEGTIEDYAEYAEGLLAVHLFACATPFFFVSQCPRAMLFITVRSASPAEVQRSMCHVAQSTGPMRPEKMREQRGRRVLHASATTAEAATQARKYNNTPAFARSPLSVGQPSCTSRRSPRAFT